MDKRVPSAKIERFSMLYQTRIGSCHINLYRLVPDQASVYRNLLAEELKTKASSLNPTTPIVSFINAGIEIQEEQYVAFLIHL